MLYRVFAVGIVLFWTLMAALLVRTELFPDRESRLPIPVEYVGHLIFRHEQPSDLVLFTQRRRLDGNFHVQPRRLPVSADRKTPANLLSVSGNFQLTLPGVVNQRVVFHGGLELDDHSQVERLELSISLHETKQSSPSLTLHLDGRPADNEWHYQITQGAATLQEGQGTPDEIFAKLDLRAYGIDPRLLAPSARPEATTTLAAHRGVLKIGDEEVETYVITVRHGENLESSVHVNQLGQILAVKTFLGYDFYDDALAP